MLRTFRIKEQPIETGGVHSSKGNQLKWRQEGYWYKADAFGYEGLAEAMVSALLAHSNVKNFVTYKPVNISYKGVTYRGCRSKNFREPQLELVPLERLSRQLTGFGLARELSRIGEVKHRIEHTVELVENLTDIQGFGPYLALMLGIDAFFLNEDRHTNNIALMYDAQENHFELCPYFDHGLSLFSDTREAYPLAATLEDCQGKIEAKPFTTDFDQALDAAESLYGVHLKFDFKANEIVKVLDASAEKWYDAYHPEEVARVKDVLRQQARKYGYMLER